MPVKPKGLKLPDNIENLHSLPLFATLSAFHDNDTSGVGKLNYMWFLPKQFSALHPLTDESRRHQILSSSLNTLLFLLFLNLGVHLLFDGLSRPELLLFFGWTFVLVLVSMVILYFQQTRAAGIVLCSGLWFSIFTFSYLHGGAHPPTLTLFAGQTVLSFLLVGGRFALFTIAVAISFLAWLQWGVTPRPSPFHNHLQLSSAFLINNSLIFLFILALLGETVRVLRRVLAAEYEQTRELQSTTVSTRWMESMLNGMADSLLVVDRHGFVQRANHASLNLLGFSEKELTGKPFWTLCPQRLRKHDDVLKVLQPLEEVELFYKHKSGRWIPVLFTASPLQEEGEELPSALVCIASDLTERKEVELELLQARHFSNEANQAQDLFLTNLTHEFKTPLHEILGYTASVLEQTNTHPRASQDLGKVTEATNKLLELVNDTLELSRLDAGHVSLNLQQVSVETLLDALQYECEKWKTNNQNTWTVDNQSSEPFVYADPQKLYKILHHLLLNAFKFTKDGAVTLALQDEEKEGCAGVGFHIIDTGIGVSEEEQQRIFQRFTQVDDSVTRLYEGSGVGLALCRQYTEMSGGTLSLTSTLGEGSTFRCWFPSSPPPHPESTTVPGSPSEEVPEENA